MDDTLSNLEEVESTFRLRGLGIIPKMEMADSSISLLLNPQAAENSLLENFRVIRTNLLSMGSLSKPPHVLMIASAMPKEGKTVVSTNLALSFAQSGAKTLLIDTDLRRGRHLTAPSWTRRTHGREAQDRKELEEAVLSIWRVDLRARDDA